jgi:lysophospholipase L1-like esterase
MRFAIVVVLLVVLGGCTTSSDGTPAPTRTSTSSAPPRVEQVYVSLGDSYAAGYRPADGGAPAGTTRDGFANLVATRAGLRLVNVACSGATSGQLSTATGCSAANRAPDAPEPAGTQLDAAVKALRDNKGHVGLVTIIIGGNDLAPCAVASDPLTCATDAVAGIQKNLAAVLPAVRAAAGDAPIVGLTYPDVFLGAWVSPDFPNGKQLARLSVSLFRDVFNTALKAEYAKIDATFVDVTEATGGYGPLTDLTQDPAYGSIPTPVAKVCALTYFCTHTDVHPTAAGHQTIADAVLTAVHR